MEPSSEQIRLLTLAEAARLLHVSTRTLQRMIRSTDLPALKVGGQWRLRESQLTEWIQRREGQTARSSQARGD
ncbi:MAG: DNA-binding protein [Deltaproteobacteria bacterium]|nr:DNA-binding protein [Deltaproteobacteria bacterium]